MKIQVCIQNEIEVFFGSTFGFLSSHLGIFKLESKMVEFSVLDPKIGLAL